VAAFTGRVEHLAQLDRLLDPDLRTNSVVISSIAGSAGVGKTALAVHWAHRRRDRFGDGQLYVHLRGYDKGRPIRPVEALAQVLRSLGVPPGQIPRDGAAAASLYRSLLADKRLLIVLDNASHPDQVRPLLPGSPDCLVLVTSRDSLAGLVAYDGAHLLTIDVLTPAEARALLNRLLTEHHRTAPRNHIDAMAKACAYLPLALRIAAAHLISHPQLDIASYIADLQSAQRLTALEIDGDPRTAIRATLDLSYRQLPPATRRLFRLLGLHPGPDIAAAAAASLDGIPVTRARQLLAQLTRTHLLTEHRPGRYTFHDLLRAYATELAEAEDSYTQRHDAVHRLLDHYLHTAYAAAVLLHPPKAPIDLAPPKQGVTPEHLAEPDQATTWYTAEHLALLGITARAADLGFDKHSWQIASIIARFLCSQGNWHELATAQRTALAAARRLEDPAAQADAHRKLAHADGRLGHYDDARKHLQDALDLHSSLADRTGQAYVHQDLAWLFGLQRRHHKVLRHARQALERYGAVGHRGGQARALNMVGWFHAQLGDFQQAITSCNEALEVYKGLRDPHGEAYVWDSLGYAHHHLGRHHEAVSCFRRALGLFQDLGDRFIRAEILTHLGDTHDALDDRETARSAWHHALTILDELGHPDADRIRGKLQPSARPGP
jgi:tetratricopeptide (TPR) repeat protein